MLVWHKWHKMSACVFCCIIIIIVFKVSSLKCLCKQNKYNRLLKTTTKNFKLLVLYKCNFFKADRLINVYAYATPIDLWFCFNRYWFILVKYYRLNVDVCLYNTYSSSIQHQNTSTHETEQRKLLERIITFIEFILYFIPGNSVGSF